MVQRFVKFCNDLSRISAPTLSPAPGQIYLINFDPGNGTIFAAALITPEVIPAVLASPSGVPMIFAAISFHTHLWTNYGAAIAPPTTPAPHLT